MNKDYIIEQLKEQIQNFQAVTRAEKIGKVLEVGDGVARITGLRDLMSQEMVEFPNGVLGVALNLEEDVAGIMILGEHRGIKEGDEVKSTGKILSVPVSEQMMGRVINALGTPIDGKGDIKAKQFYPAERIAPGVITRQSVNAPLQTGIKAIDSMIPIGKGQRELIIGDRQTGKTAIAEYFMDQGKDVLIVYDDLSRHAWAYRQISLILRRPPGREAYPGDIFYLHSRLLERSCKLSKELGGGSITALPIIETQAGDVSAYIPTNVISITDGQIYLESDLFYKGIRPALNVGLSVSRVGSAAQIKAIKKVAGKLRLDLAQFRELESFAQFGSDLDEKTRAHIERGRRAVEILKQTQCDPLPVENQVAILYALINGYLDDVSVEKIKDWENGFYKFLKTQGKEAMELLAKEKDLTDEVKQKLEQAIKEFKELRV